MKKVKRLKIELTLGIFILITTLISGFIVFSPISIWQIAQAITGDYNRAVTGDIQLDSDDWDLLDEDFVAKSGGTDAVMTGPLTLSGDPTLPEHAANMNYVDVVIQSLGTLTDSSGNGLKVVCGGTPEGSTNWQQTSGVTDVVWVEVNTSSAGFTPGTVPVYFTNLSGNTQLFRTYGVTNIYNPDYNSFRVYIVRAIGSVSPAEANLWGWHIKYCGVGQF